MEITRVIGSLELYERLQVGCCSFAEARVCNPISQTTITHLRSQRSIKAGLVNYPFMLGDWLLRKPVRSFPLSIISSKTGVKSGMHWRKLPSCDETLSPKWIIHRPCQSRKILLTRHAISIMMCSTSYLLILH